MTRRFRVALAITLPFLLGQFAPAATVVHFTSGDLTAEPGSDGTMHYLDDGSQTTELATEFGTTASGASPLAGVPDLPDGPASIMHFPGSSGASNGYRIDYHRPDNDGPTVGYLDSYSLVVDVLIASDANQFVGIFNSNEANDNDAEVWIDFDSSATAGTGGFWRHGAGANSLETLNAGQWHRVALVVRDSAELDIFVDGSLVADNVPWDNGDSLYTTTSPDPTFGGANFSILGDGSGFHGDGYVSSIAFMDTPLSDESIAALGGPAAAGIPIPEPSSLALAMIAVVGLSQSVRHRRERRLAGGWFTP